MPTGEQIAGYPVAPSQNEDAKKGTAVIDTGSAGDQQSMSNPAKQLEQGSLSSLEESKPYHFVDSCSAVADLLDSLVDLQTNPPSLYVDLEGVHLGRHGTISIIQILTLPQKRTYLIDVHTLGSEAFSTPGISGQTLKMIFESEAIPKVFFDVRNDSDALFSHFGIRLAAVQDIQLMEFASRRAYHKFLTGLSKCMERDLVWAVSERQKWQATKENGLKLFAPERGGSYEVFNARPLSEDLSLYCAQDVQYLPQLWSGYSSKLRATVLAKLRTATDDRVKLSQTKTYDGHGRHMAIGPW